VPFMNQIATLPPLSSCQSRSPLAIAVEITGLNDQPPRRRSNTCSLGDPATIPPGWLLAVEIGKSVATPSVVMRPILLTGVAVSVNHSAPSAGCPGGAHAESMSAVAARDNRLFVCRGTRRRACAGADLYRIPGPHSRRLAWSHRGGAVKDYARCLTPPKSTPSLRPQLEPSREGAEREAT
jgi:hypothetical protein